VSERITSSSNESSSEDICFKLAWSSFSIDSSSSFSSSSIAIFAFSILEDSSLILWASCFISSILFVTFDALAMSLQKPSDEACLSSSASSVPLLSRSKATP